MSSIDNTLEIPPEPRHIMQANAIHLGVVRDVKDPEGRGRVQVECSEINSTGQPNWMNWCEVGSIPVSSAIADGDYGIWWPLVPGQAVFVTFCGPTYTQPVVYPGPATGELQNEIGGEAIPLEAKVIMDQDLRKGTRIRVLKSESGCSLIIDDNGQQETMELLDWTGTGLFWCTPGKTADAKENTGDGSQWRKGVTRGTKSAMAQDAPKPSQISATGSVIAGFLDVNGQGWISFAKDGAGIFASFAGGSPGECNPSCIMDSKDNLVLITAGETQLRVDGKMGHVYATSQIIWEPPLTDPQEFFGPAIGAIKSSFTKFQGASAPSAGPIPANTGQLGDNVG